MDAIPLLKHVHFLVNGIAHGESDLKNEDIECMQELVTKIEKNASSHKMKGEMAFGQTFRKINQIKMALLERNTPKFPLPLLAKSSFLRLEKIKDCYKKCMQGEMPIVENDENTLDEESIAVYDVADGSELSIDLPQPPDSSSDSISGISTTASDDLADAEKLCESCRDYRAKYGEEYLKILQEPELSPEPFRIPDADDEEEPKKEEIRSKRAKD
ncbi:unnamed protein product, partial [Nesidiocoris tenuis]